MPIIFTESAKPLIRPVLVGLLAAVPPPAVCNGSGSALPASAVEFGCSEGKVFRARMFAADAEVITSAAAYRLHRRPSSAGLKFSSAEVTFIVDEDRIVLVGAAGGPYQDCRKP